MWFLFISISGMIGNSIAIRVLTTSVTIRKNTSCTLLVSQSCIDLISCCTMFAEICTSGLLSNYNFRSNSSADYFLCVLWVSDLPFMAAVLVSSYNLAAVSVDRAVSIRYPVMYRHMFNGKRTHLRIVWGAWLLGVSVKLALMLPTTGVKNGHCKDWDLFPGHTHRKAFGISLLMLTYVFPVSVIAFSYYSIYVNLRQRKMNSEMVRGVIRAGLENI